MMARRVAVRDCQCACVCGRGGGRGSHLVGAGRVRVARAHVAIHCHPAGARVARLHATRVAHLRRVAHRVGACRAELTIRARVGGVRELLLRHVLESDAQLKHSERLRHGNATVTPRHVPLLGPVHSRALCESNAAPRTPAPRRTGSPAARPLTRPTCHSAGRWERETYASAPEHRAAVGNDGAGSVAAQYGCRAGAGVGDLRGRLFATQNAEEEGTAVPTARRVRWAGARRGTEGAGLGGDLGAAHIERVPVLRGLAVLLRSARRARSGRAHNAGQGTLVSRPVHPPSARGTSFAAAARSPRSSVTRPWTCRRAQASRYGERGGAGGAGAGLAAQLSVCLAKLPYGSTARRDSLLHVLARLNSYRFLPRLVAFHFSLCFF